MKANDIVQTAKLRRVLNKFGFAKLEERDLVAQMASLVRDHAHFRSLLTACVPEERTAMYEQMRPHLKFTPLALDQYTAAAGREAERKQLPTVAPDGTLQEFRPAADMKSVTRAAEEAIAAEMAKGTLTVVCWKCTTEAHFHGDTIAGATIAARKAGWVYVPNKLADKEICPKCAPVRKYN